MFLFHFKGTTSWEEHNTIHSIYTTIESTSTGRIVKIRLSLSAYSRSTVPRVHHTTTVWQVLLPYIILCWLAPIDGPTSSPYSYCMVQGQDRTVAVWWWRGTVWGFNWFMMTKFAPVLDFKIVCTRTQTIIIDLFNRLRLIQKLWRRLGPFYAPLVTKSL